MICHICNCSSPDVVLFCPECGMATCKLHVASNPDPSMRLLKPTICIDCASSLTTRMVQTAEIAQAQREAQIAANQRAKEEWEISERQKAEERQRIEEERLFHYNNDICRTIDEPCPACQGTGEVSNGVMTFLTGARTCSTCLGEKTIERKVSLAEYNRWKAYQRPRGGESYSTIKDRMNSGISDMSDRW